MKVVRIRRREEASTVIKASRSGRDRTPRSLGVRKRGEGFHLEVRTGSSGCPKIHGAHFSQDRERAEVAHDVARLCLLGKDEYLKLPKNKLNYWEKRDSVAALLCGDGRMMALADAHRRKDEAGQNWDADMKTRLRELASDALELIQLLQKAEAQEEVAAPQPSAAEDSQNFNGYVNPSTLGDERSPFDIDGGLCSEDGAARENWPCTKESLRSITPELPEQSLEDQVWSELPEQSLEDMLWNRILPLEAENKKLKAENKELKAENKELKALRGENARFM